MTLSKLGRNLFIVEREMLLKDSVASKTTAVSSSKKKAAVRLSRIGFSINYDLRMNALLRWKHQVLFLFLLHKLQVLQEVKKGITGNVIISIFLKTSLSYRFF